MPELPEITVLAKQLNQELVGRRFNGIEVIQPKSLNLPPEVFKDRVIDQEVEQAYAHGKWIVVVTSDGYLLINLGMGGEVLLRPDRQDLPEKHRVILDFDDGACLTINFWWFGTVHWADRLEDHPQVSQLGRAFMSLSLDEFRELLVGRRGGIKSFLLNQKRVAGIGNVYVQDPLFKARIHPLRPINSLSDDEITALWRALRETLQQSIDLGGSHWEQNLYGEHGHWDSSFFQVAYREGQPCPSCGTPVEKVKTGSTSTHICPQCQV